MGSRSRERTAPWSVGDNNFNEARASAGDRPAGESESEADETHHSSRETLQARRGSRGPRGGGRRRPDGLRGQGLRPTKGPYGNLPRRGIPGDLRAEGETGSRRGR